MGVQKRTPFVFFVQFPFILIYYKMKAPRKIYFKSALLLSQDISYILIIMDKEEFINVFILKSVLRDNRLTFLERLLLIHIISLCKKNCYCWATNRYFCDIYNVTQVTISESISNLATFGYIKTEYDNTSTNNSKRIIKLSEVLNLKIKSIKDNFNTSYKQNFKQYNNKLNKKEDSIYYKDEDGNEYWHGKLIPKNEATIEEQEELKKLLSDIYEEE